MRVYKIEWRRHSLQRSSWLLVWRAVMTGEVPEGATYTREEAIEEIRKRLGRYDALMKLLKRKARRRTVCAIEKDLLLDLAVAGQRIEGCSYTQHQAIKEVCRRLTEKELLHEQRQNQVFEKSVTARTRESAIA